jgi:hypothetical protein
MKTTPTPLLEKIRKFHSCGSPSSNLDPYKCLTRGVTHCGLAIYIKMYLKAKEELWKLKYLPCKNIIFKKSSKRIQNPSRYYNSITNLKFQHKPKYHLSKILI